MAGDTTKPAPETRVASLGDVHTAIANLSPTDIHRLVKFAEVQLLKVPGTGGPADGMELVNEAFERLLLELRGWKQGKVEFMGLLYGAIKSLADNWRRKMASPVRGAISFSSMQKRNDDGEGFDPTLEFRGPTPDPAQMTLYRDTLEQIDATFANDDEARTVLEGLKERMTPAEIRDCWGLSKEKYNAIVVRIRRHLKRVGLTDPTKDGRYVQ